MYEYRCRRVSNAHVPVTLLARKVVQCAGTHLLCIRAYTGEAQLLMRISIAFFEESKSLPKPLASRPYTRVSRDANW